MYHGLLTNRYLTTRVIPLIAVAAVGLCVALVIIVVSVMSGFLDMVKSSGRTLIGDVVITYPVSGIGHYEDLIERLDEHPDVMASTPVASTFGLLKMPYPMNREKDVTHVEIWGISPESFAQVTGFEEALYWRPLDDETWEARFQTVVTQLWNEFRAAPGFDETTFAADEGDDARLKIMDLDFYDRIVGVLPEDTAGLRELVEREWAQSPWFRLTNIDPQLKDMSDSLSRGQTLIDDRKDRPGIVLGMHVSIANERMRDGSYQPMGDGFWWMPGHEVTLTTIPVAETGQTFEPKSLILPVVNEMMSGVYMIDETRVIVRLEDLQELMELQEAARVDPDDPTEILGTYPARATSILIRAAEGVSPEALKAVVEETYDAFHRHHVGLQAADGFHAVPPPRSTNMNAGAQVMTWLESQAQFIGPVEKERQLMRTLFSIIYIVCAGLVLSIFWAIVYEKTRDIGILRSVGASRLGITWIFMRYGLMVGSLGALLGLGIGWLIVHKINAIHDAMGDPPLTLAYVLVGLAVVTEIITIIKGRTGHLLPLVVGNLCVLALAAGATGIFVVRASGGIVIWDPKVYYFTVIPNEIDLQFAFITMGGAILFCLLGAFIPAAKAADTDPVKALRYE